MNPLILSVKVCFIIASLFVIISCKPSGTQKLNTRYTYRSYQLLTNDTTIIKQTLDTAVNYGVNVIELTHYQLCHFLSDLNEPKNLESVTFAINQAHKRNLQVYLWDHALYSVDYYPDRFKVQPDTNNIPSEFKNQKNFDPNKKILNLDDPNFWQWVYADYDKLLAKIPQIEGITLTFIETGSYVIYQHSDKLKTGEEKLSALVDSLAHYFIDRKGLKLNIRTFIYNEHEKKMVLGGLKLIKHKGIVAMMKMVPHDWFLTYPFETYTPDLPFPVIIEYDGGMEYAGENIINNSFCNYFTSAFKHYNKYPNVMGYSVRVNRYGTTKAVGTPGEINLYALSSLCNDSTLTADSITHAFLIKNYGIKAAPLLKSVFDSAFSVVLSSMYTLGTHTADHSRLNFHRNTIYQSHTTGEWYAPNNQMWFVSHGVNKWLHNYKDVINGLSFVKHKTDTIGLRRDIGFVLDSNWLSATEAITPELLAMVNTEKQYAINLAQLALKQTELATPFISDTEKSHQLQQSAYLTLLFTRERAAVANAVYGYRLYCKEKTYQTAELKASIMNSLTEADSIIKIIENYPEPLPSGQWNWFRDRESFEIYRKAITQEGWPEFGLPKID